MDCSDVQKRIDEMPLDKNFGLDKDVLFHIRNCSECRKYYDDHIRMAKILSNLRNQQPELKNPDDIKLVILSSIENEKNATGRNVFPMLYLIRFLAAATVILLVTLGVEQYMVLQKVQHLEVQLGKVEQPSATQEMILYQSSLIDIKSLLSNGDHNLSMNKLLLVLQMKRIGNSNFTYKDLKRNINKDKSIQQLIRAQHQQLKKQKP